MEPVLFELSKPFTYANGVGAEVECNHIVLMEPTGKVSHICCAIEGLIQSSLIQMAEQLGADVVEEAKEAAATTAKTKDKDVVEEEKDGDAVLALMVGGGADMSKIVLHFRDLFKHVAMMGGEKKITSARLDDLSHKDLRKMIGVYAANFILS